MAGFKPNTRVRLMFDSVDDVDCFQHDLKDVNVVLEEGFTLNCLVFVWNFHKDCGPVGWVEHHHEAFTWTGVDWVLSEPCHLS